MKKKFTYLFWLPFVLLSLHSFAQNSTAVSLNGTTDYVSTTAQIIPASGPFTVEFWVYVPGSAIDGNPHEFISQGTPGNNAFYIGYDGTGQLQAGDSWTAVGDTMPTDQWVNIALTYDGNGSASIYINDIDDGDAFSFAFTGGGAPFAIGQMAGATLMNGRIDELKVWNTVLSDTLIKSTWWSVDPATAGLLAYYPMNEGTGSILGNTTATTGEDGTLQGSAAWISSPIQFNHNALTFDATTNNYVVIPGNPQYDLPGTVEFWVNPGTITGSPTLIGVDGASTLYGGVPGTRFSFYLTSSTIGMQGASGTTTISLPSNFTPSDWNHMAFIFDNTNDTVGVYVNGVYAGQFNQAIDNTIISQPLVIGANLSSGSPVDAFTGSIDEVRVWSTMQQPSDIVTYMNTTLTGFEPNLGSLFSFDQGTASGDNSFLVTAIDNTTNNNHGTLTGFSLTGAASNFIDHPISLPVNFTNFTAINQKGQAYLQWQTAQEENSSDYSVERSVDGVNFASIGTVPAAGHSTMPLNYSFVDPTPATGNDYYRIKEIDLDNHFMYSVIRVLNFATNKGRELVWFRTGDKAVEVDYRDGNNELYTVYDMNGNAIQQGQLSSGKLYLNQVAAGLYSVKIITAGGTELNTKVLVQ